MVVTWSEVRSRLRRDAGDPLLRSAYSLVANGVVTSALGVGFWVAAARMFRAPAVGRDSALVSAMIGVSTICSLNLGSGMLRFLPVSRMRPSRVVLGSYAVTTLVSAAGGMAFVSIAPRVSAAYTFLANDLALAATWVLAVTAWGIFSLQDAVLTALRRAPWVALENGGFGVLKLVALPLLLALGSAHAVFTAWAVPMIMLLVPVNYAIFKAFIPVRPAAGAQLSPVEQLGWGGVTRFLANDYLAMIFIEAGSTLLPAVVVGLVGARRGAYFYMPFAIVMAFDHLFFSVFSSVTVEGAVAPERLASLVRTALRRFGPVLVAGVVALTAGAAIVLAPFGHGYVHGGTSVLQLLACASPFRLVIVVFCAVYRVRGRAGPVVVVQAAVFVLVLGLTETLARSHGLAGVGSAWLVANAIVAAGLARPTLRVLRAYMGAAPAAGTALS